MGSYMSDLDEALFRSAGPLNGLPYLTMLVIAYERVIPTEDLIHLSDNGFVVAEDDRLAPCNLGCMLNSKNFSDVGTLLCPKHPLLVVLTVVGATRDSPSRPSEQVVRLV